MEERKKFRGIYTILFILAAVVTAYYQYTYQKYKASWYGFNIYFWASFLSAAIALGMNYVNYFIATKLGDDYNFDYKNFVPPPFVYVLMTIACLATVYLGVTYTEPDNDWSSGHTEISQNDRYQHSTFYQWYYVTHSYNTGTISSSSDSGSSSSSDDKDGEAYAILALILLIVFILLLSATVQHFWVIGSIAILLMLAQFL